ncbi:hypothetical protein ABTZ03_01095 [Kitasatospora sp. NPDC096077]
MTVHRRPWKVNGRPDHSPSRTCTGFSHLLTVRCLEQPTGRRPDGT